MNVKKSLFLTAITLLTFVPGWSKTEASPDRKNNYQKRLAKVPRNDRDRRIRNIQRSDRNIYKQLKQKADLSELTVETSFSEAIEILQNSTTPPLKIIVLWRDLRENADVERTTPIYFDGVSGIPLGYGLEILLRSVSRSPNQLSYVVQGGTILIASKESLGTKMVARIYDISDLLAGPAGYGFNFRGGFARGWPMGPYGAGRNQRFLRGGRGMRTYGPGVRRWTGPRTAPGWVPNRGRRGWIR